MGDPLAPAWLVTIGEYLQEESEKQWFWFSIFVITLLVGALWLQASLILPGVETSAILNEGEILEEVVWNEEGEQALVLVGRRDTYPLFTMSETGERTIPSPAISDISLIDGGWLVAGGDGYLAIFDGTSLQPVTLEWTDDSPRHIVSVGSNDGSEGFMVTKDGAETFLHTFVDGTVSIGSPPPISTTVMTDVLVDDDGALAIVIGYDTALGNPTFGPAGEVVMRADAILGDPPNLVLLHHGAGGAIHTTHFFDEGEWGEDVRMLLAGSTSTMLLMSDSTIRDLPAIPGSSAAAVDESGVIWFADGDSALLYSISPLDEKVKVHNLPTTEVVDASHAGTNSHGIVFYGEGVKGDVMVLEFDAGAQDSVSTSLARFGDLLFVFIALFCFVMAGQIIYENRH